MKILLFGKNGQVGWELNRSLQILGDVVALGREEADFSTPESLRDIIRQVKPDVIVNAVAYTAVDKAETEEDIALIINSIAVGVIAEESLRINALLIHYSTDYVFDGAKEGSYVETDEPNPINAYGRTKLAGEQAIMSSGCDYLIFRTSWVYAARGHNFLLMILRLAKERDELGIVSDQYGAPTSARLISDVTSHCVFLAMKEKKAGGFASGLYHLSSADSASWHDFAAEIISLQNKVMGTRSTVKKMNAITTADYPTPAKRPMNSKLFTGKLENDYEILLPSWKTGLEICIGEIACSQDSCNS